MTMVKQRRSFFVDDILHMVMPKEKTSNYTNEITDRKRKRSRTPDNEPKEEDESLEENSLNKKFRPFNHANDRDDDDDDDDDGDHDESKHSQIVDVLGDGGGTGDESSISDDSNSVDNNSGK